MKKIFKILLLVIVAGIIVAGAGFFAYNSGVLAGNPSISESEAKSIAVDHLGGEVKSIHYEKEGTSNVYEVVVVTEDGTFEVEIDADNGKVLEVESEDGSEDDDDQEDDELDDDEEDDNELDDNEDGDELDDDEQDDETKTA